MGLCMRVRVYLSSGGGVAEARAAARRARRTWRSLTTCQAYRRRPLRPHSPVSDSLAPIHPAPSALVARSSTLLAGACRIKTTGIYLADSNNRCDVGSRLNPHRSISDRTDQPLGQSENNKRVIRELRTTIHPSSLTSTNIITSNHSSTNYVLIKM